MIVEDMLSSCSLQLNWRPYPCEGSNYVLLCGRQINVRIHDHDYFSGPVYAPAHYRPGGKVSCSNRCVTLLGWDFVNGSRHHGKQLL